MIAEALNKLRPGVTSLFKGLGFRVWGLGFGD